jgi:hypothetical protein
MTPAASIRDSVVFGGSREELLAAKNNAPSLTGGG